MKIHVIFILIVMCLIAPATIWAGYDDGIEAYNKADYESALRNLAPLAEQGNSDAQVKVGILYFNGLGVSKNYSEAGKWFLRAASQGDTTAQRMVAKMHINGEGFKEDYLVAVKWYQKAIEAGNIEAQNELAHMYINNQGFSLDETKILAGKGNSIAQYALGFIYKNGFNVKQNNDDALIWLHRAAEAGNVYAQNELGHLYESINKSSDAVKWFREASEKGLPLAQNNLATMYRLGKGVDKNIDEALRLYELAAKNGNLIAKFKLGYIYYLGKEAAQDKNKAFILIESVAKSREINEQQIRAQHLFGLMHLFGDGTVVNPNEAIGWFTIAANKGNALSQSLLGDIFEEGEVVTKDAVRSAKWFMIADRFGEKEAKNKINKLKKTINKSDWNDAVAAAKAFRLKSSTMSPEDENKWLNTYRGAFKKAKSFDEFWTFIYSYENDDPDKLVPVASQKADISRKDEAFARLRNMKKYGIAILKSRIYDVSEYTEGTGFEVTYYNPTKKTIKYITTNLVGYNAVGDPVKVKGGKTQATVKGIGPVEPDSSAGYSYEYTWFTDLVETYKIVSIKVQYMDGSSTTVNDPKKAWLDRQSYDLITGETRDVALSASASAAPAAK